ncbi:hypothetical protein STTU_4586 [Streptomyces sp. Tu6071]|nr:hypothetical protein STTU_4586 [Streptomyces sp. Tu6071]
MNAAARLAAAWATGITRHARPSPPRRTTAFPGQRGVHVRG